MEKRPSSNATYILRWVGAACCGLLVGVGLYVQDIGSSDSRWMQTKVVSSGSGQDLRRMISAQNQILLEGDDIQDSGDTAIVSLESAQKGITFRVPFSTITVFHFGDGTQAVADALQNETSVTHSYYEKRRYDVVALAQTSDGKILSLEKKIIVGGIQAQITVNNRVQRLGQGILFSGNRSSSQSGNIIAYEWSCVQGPDCFDEVIPQEKFEVIFEEAGDYIVELMVRDATGNTATDQIQVTIERDAQVAEFLIEPVGGAADPGRYKFSVPEEATQAPPGTTFRYVWRVDDQEFRTNDPFLIHEFKTPGEREVSLTVLTRRGFEERAGTPKTMRVKVPTTLGIDFYHFQKTSGGGASVVESSPVEFEARGGRGDILWEWVFPDGTTSREAQTKYTFTQKGHQSVTLRGRSGTEENTITKVIPVLRDGRPTALASVMVNGKPRTGKSVSVGKNDTITIRSESLNTQGGTANIRSSWTIDGTPVSEDEIRFFLREEGRYLLKLTVMQDNDVSLQDTQLLEVRIENQPPEISALEVIPQPQLGNTFVRVEAKASDPDGEITQYRFEAVEKGTVVASQIVQEPSALFDLSRLSGSREVFFRVIVQDNSGAQDRKASSDTFAFESDYRNNPPTVSILSNPGNNGEVGALFTFAANAQDADNDALTYEWTLPDGSTKTQSFVPYRFDTPGEHMVRLVVSDGVDDVSAEYLVRIFESLQGPVNDENPGNISHSSAEKAPIANIRGILPRSAGSTKTVFYFFGETMDDPGPNAEYEWDFGDDQVIFRRNAAFKFSEPGEYTVTFRVKNSAGADSQSMRVVVVEPGERIPKNDPNNNIDELIQSIDEYLSASPLEYVDILSSHKSNPEYFHFEGEEIQRMKRRLRDMAPPAPYEFLSQDEKELFEERKQTLGQWIELLERNPVSLVDWDTIDSLASESYLKKNSLSSEDQQQAQIIKTALLNLLHNPDYRGDEYLSQALGIIRERAVQTYRRSVRQEDRLSSRAMIDTIDRALSLMTQESGTLLSYGSYKNKLMQEREKAHDAETLKRLDIELFELESSDMFGTVGTEFFLYAKVETAHEKPISFSWKLEDGQVHNGQNLRRTYAKPGLHTITLEVFDGLTSVEDSIKIKIVPREALEVFSVE